VPTYQYSCTECGHFFETVQSFSDDSLTVCPNCGGRLRKVFNAVGVVFKGSGFYRNDSRQPQSEGASENGSKAPEKTAAKTAEKSSEKTSSTTKSDSSSASTSTPAATT
jgi:putative FmdB family regulatory protein